MVSKGRERRKCNFTRVGRFASCFFRDKKMKTTSHQLIFRLAAKPHIKIPIFMQRQFLTCLHFPLLFVLTDKIKFSTKQEVSLKGAGTGRNFHPQRPRQPRYLKSKTELCVDINVLSLKSNLCLQWNDKRMI